MIFIGIDPGLRTGAVGAIDHHGALVGCFEIAAESDRLNIRELRDGLRQLQGKDDSQIVVEDVFAYPGQGLASTARFMRAAGAIEAVSMLSGVTHFVSPRKWKGDMRLTADKGESLTRARKLWPEASLGKAKDHGKAEALLLAEWLRQKFTT